MRLIGRLSLVPLALLIALALGQDGNDRNPAPPEGYVSVAEILPLPEFIPGVGALFIHPDSAPVGPWLVYGNDGQLVEVMFMIPLSQMQEFGDWNDLATGTFDSLGLGTVQHVDVTYNGGHPGMAEPHYHIRLVLVDNETQQEALAE